MKTPSNELKIGGKKFKLHRLFPLQALHLDKQINELILNSIGASKSVDGSLGGLHLHTLMGGLSLGLRSLSRDEFEALVLELCSPVVVEFPPGSKKAPIQIDSKVHFESAFEDEGPAKIYELIFAVMRFNQFLPFEVGTLLEKMGDIGEEIKTMFFSNEPEPEASPSKTE